MHSQCCNPLPKCPHKTCKVFLPLFANPFVDSFLDGRVFSFCGFPEQLLQSSAREKFISLLPPAPHTFLQNAEFTFC